MEKLYFLTSIFENKFGKAKKYYDGDSWHWMLNSDQPEIYETIEEAKKKAISLSGEELSELSIKEVLVYEDVWEHKIPKENLNVFLEKNGQPSEVIFFNEQKKYYLFLSVKKQCESAKIVRGLYCVERKDDIWIYCKEKGQGDSCKVKYKPEQLIKCAYEKLKDVRSLFELLEEEQIKIDKVESLTILMEKLYPRNYFIIYKGLEKENSISPDKTIKNAFEKIIEAKERMIELNYDQTVTENTERLIQFYERSLHFFEGN